MKRISLIVYMVTIAFIAVGQNDLHLLDQAVTIEHTNYKTTFSKALKYPVLVSWWDTKAKVSCSGKLVRKDTFCPDPVLPINLMNDYKGSTYDRGHNCPADDNLCQTTQVERECFYFTNMTPQWHRFNAGSWRNLEMLTRNLAKQYDSIHVWCGAFGTAEKMKSVSVPTHQWKVIYIKSRDQYRAFIFRNVKDDLGNGKLGVEIPIDSIIKLTNFKFDK